MNSTRVRCHITGRFDGLKYNNHDCLGHFTFIFVLTIFQVTVVIDLIVSDVNDEVPVFQNLPYNVDLSEVKHVRRLNTVDRRVFKLEHPEYKKLLKTV